MPTHADLFRNKRKLPHFLLLALLAVGCTATPSDTDEIGDGVVEENAPEATKPVELTPRAPIASPPLPTTLVPGQRYQLVVKFTDEARARVTDDHDLKFQSSRSPMFARSVAQAHGLKFKKALQLSDDALEALQARAAEASSEAQPDLAGIVTLHSTSADPNELLATARELENKDDVEYVYMEPIGVPAPTDIPPTSASFVADQSYRTTWGVDSDYANSVNAKGQGVRFSDIEFAWRYGHEDLNELNLHPEPGQTPDPIVYTRNDDHHGTAVVGMIVGLNNAYGISGMAPQATVYTYPAWTVQRGYAINTSLANAITQSASGDVITIEVQTYGPSGEYVPAEYDPTFWTLVKSAEQSGILVVSAAGNSGIDLDAAAYTSYRNRGDSGALMVGAGSMARSRIQTTGWGSNYGSRVNVQGWGANVVTLGYGDKAQYNNDPNQSYTSLFSGTSSAAAMVTGVVVLTQSYALQKIGRYLTPAEMRTLLVATGRPQVLAITTGNIGPLPNIRNAFKILERWPVTTTNRVQDPGFELQPSAAVAAPWSGVGDYRWIEQNLGHQRSGTDNGIIFTDASSPAGYKAFTQNVTMTSNTDYKLSAWVRGTSGISGNLLLKHPSSGGYTYATMPFNPKSQTAYQKIEDAFFNSGYATTGALELGYNSTPTSTQWTYLDDFELVAVNPATDNGNILVDPSFDSQTATTLAEPWVATGSSAVELGLGKSRRGPNDVVLASSDSGQTKKVTQRVAVRPSTFYKVRAYQKGSVNLVTSITAALPNGTVIGRKTQPIGSSTKYDQIYMEFSTGPTTTSIDLSFGYVSTGSSVYVQFDDCSLFPMYLSHPVNAVRDPGYEAHASTSLVYPFWARGTSASVTTNAGPHGGTKNAVVTTTGTGVVGTMAQDLALGYATPYTLKVWANANVASLTAKLGVKQLTGEVVAEKTVTLGTAYQELVLDFTSTTNTSAYVYLTYTSPGGTVTMKVDDWSLVRR